MAWLTPELGAGADAEPGTELVRVVVTPEPPDVVCTTVDVVPAVAGVPDADVVVVWVTPGSVYATAPATTRPAAPAATVAARSRAFPRRRATTADSASRLLAFSSDAPPWLPLPLPLLGFLCRKCGQRVSARPWNGL